MNAPQNEDSSKRTPVTFDAAALGTSQNAEKPKWFEIQNNVDGSGTGLLFQVVGRDSKAYRALSRRFINKKFDRMATTRKLKMTAEENEAEGIDLLAECILAFKSRQYERADGVLVPVQPESFADTVNILGEELSFSKENVKRIFKTVPEIKEQLDDFMQDRVNFLPGPQTA